MYEKKEGIDFGMTKYIVIAFICITLFFAFYGVTKLFTAKTSDNYTKEIITKASEYISKNEIIIPVGEIKYLSFNEIDFKNKKCNSSGGVAVENIWGTHEYNTYYVCDNKVSETINAITKNDDPKYISLLGNNPLILNPDEPYKEPGYNKNKDNIEVEIKEEIETEPGIYFVRYIITTEDDIVELTRVIIRKDKENEYLDSDAEIKVSYPEVVLVGEEVIHLLKGDAYTEPGYTASDKKDGDITNDVSVIGNINTKVKGTYTLSYRVTNSDGKMSSRYRIIIVSDPTISMITLKGSVTVKLTKGDTYKEPGYSAKYNNKDITDDVEVNGEVDTAAAGTYYINYAVTNSLGQKDTATRVIIVNDKTSVPVSVSKILSYSKSTTTATHGNVRIDIWGNYDYVILPNGMKSTNREETYEVSTNGSYKFTGFYSDNTSKSVSVSITNIDKTAPSGHCTLKDNKITVTLETSSANIAGYAYSADGISYTAYSKVSSYTLTGSSTKAYVKIKNNAGTESTFECQVLSSTEASNVNTPIGVPDTYKKYITSTVNTETLKMDLVRKSDYTMVFMWVKDINSQFKVASAEMTGLSGSGSTPNKLINNAASKNIHGLKNKPALAFNLNVMASYFGSSKRGNYPRVSLLLENGKQTSYIDYSNAGFDTSWGLGYFDKDNNMNIYNGANTKEEERKKEIQKIIDSGAKNTFSVWHMPLIKNGIAQGGRSPYFLTNTAHNILCQIDANNYIFVSRSSKLTTVGLEVSKLGCIWGFITDGGGSTDVAFKTQKETSFKHYRVSNRGKIWSAGFITSLD